MTKKRERSEVEQLRGVIRNQRSIIKNLKKEISRVTKRESRTEDLEEILAEEMLEQDQEDIQYIKEDKCPQCKGRVEVVTLGPKKLVICDGCGYRKAK